MLLNASNLQPEQPLLCSACCSPQHTCLAQLRTQVAKHIGPGAEEALGCMLQMLFEDKKLIHMLCNVPQCRRVKYIKATASVCAEPLLVT